MALTVTLYNCNDDKRVANKTLTVASAPITAQIYEDSSVLNPRLVLAWNLTYTSYNYMYIQEYGRYYYINDIVATPGGKCIITAHVDVLMTYYSVYTALPAIVTRNSRLSHYSWERSTWINDPKLPISSGKTIRAVKFEGSGLNITTTASMTSHNFVLNVAGGGAITP